MKVMIIGSGGYIGSHLLKFLRAKGIQVQGISSGNGTGIDPHTGILPDDFSIAPGTNVAIYLAQSPYYNMMPEMFSHLLNVNVVSAVKIAESARKAKIARLIYASTGNVYTPSFAPLSESSPLRRDNRYSLSKVHAEEALCLYKKDMDVTIMRIFGIYGPNQTGKLVPNLLNSVIQGKEISIQRNPEDLNDLDGLKISLCYVEDAVEIISNLITQGGVSCINIAGDEAVSIRKMITLMGRHLKKKPAFKIADKCRRYDLIADITLLKRTLNPQFTPFEIGLEQTIGNSIA